MLFKKELVDTNKKLKRDNRYLKRIINEAKILLKEYQHTDVEEYEKIVEFYKRLKRLLEKVD